MTPLVSIDLVFARPTGGCWWGVASTNQPKAAFLWPGAALLRTRHSPPPSGGYPWRNWGGEQIEEARFLGVYEHFYATNNRERAGFGTHYVVLAYELACPTQDLRLPNDQHGEFAWLTEADLLRCPDVHANTKAYFSSMKKSSQLPRRSFLKGLGLAAPVVMGGERVAFAQSQVTSTSPAAASKTPVKELAADLVIIGGGLGGCAAALAAARNGLRVIMTEETDWIGGQLTAQAVPPDENPWIETFGGTRSYLELRAADS